MLPNCPAFLIQKNRLPYWLQIGAAIGIPWCYVIQKVHTLLRSTVTVPALGFGISPLGPNSLPSFATCRTPLCMSDDTYECTISRVLLFLLHTMKLCIEKAAEFSALTTKNHKVWRENQKTHTLGIMSGVAISLSKSMKPPAISSIKSSPPTKSAPAVFASCCFSPVSTEIPP